MDTTRFWRAIEAVHDPVYFAPGAARRYTELGLKGFWMGYLASRSAALGTPGPALVTALFHGFAPERVARGLPDAWTLADRDAVLAARLEAAVEAIGPHLGDVDAGALADRLGAIAGSVSWAGLPLAAAHADLPEPTEPVARLWHHATALRELHGDAHVAVLTSAGVDGVQANVLAEALGLVPSGQREMRGWTEDEWSAGADRLRERGWVDEQGAPTQLGRQARADLETTTHRVAEAALRPGAGADLVEEVTAPLVAIAGNLAAAGVLRYPNPTGVAGP